MILRYIFLIIFSLCISITWAISKEQAVKYRNIIYRAIVNESVNDSLYKSLHPIITTDPLLLGYTAISEALKAKHTWNPYTKVKFLIVQEETFKKAISQAPGNLELRFLRFSVEHNCPGFIGFSKHIIEDKEMFIKLCQQKKYGYVDKKLLTNMIDFLIKSTRCTASEVKWLKDFKQNI